MLAGTKGFEYQTSDGLRRYFLLNSPESSMQGAATHFNSTSWMSMVEVRLEPPTFQLACH